MRFCWHNYTTWSKAIESCGGSLHQVCSCTKCGAIKRRQAISSSVTLLGAGRVNDALADIKGTK